MSGSTSKRYPVELRERAVRMVAEIRADHESEWAAMAKVAELLGIGTVETVRKWCRQAEVDAGQRAGMTTEESAELKRLKAENAELKRANAILRSASVFFAAELGRPRRCSSLTSTSTSAFATRTPRGQVCDGVSSRSALSSPSSVARSPPRPTTNTG